MGKKFAALALIGIVFGIVIISYEVGTNPGATFEADVHELAEFYGKNKLAFILPPDEPQPSTIIEEREVIKQIELQNGTVVNQTVVEQVEIPIESSILLKGTDKQTGKDAYVKQGHQYLIEAAIELYDAFDTYVEPPYRFSLTITCEFRDFCDNSRTKFTSPNAKTDGEGGFSYLWTTNFHDSIGDYNAVLLVRSVDKYDKNTGQVCFDSTPDCRYLDYSNTLTLEIVA